MSSTPRDLVGVILAAGRGNRMAPFSKKFPKPILPICNQPLMAYQIKIMQEVGIQQVFIVVGHLGYEISRLMGDGAHLGVSIHYVEQTEMLGIAHAVGQLEPYLKTPFMLFLGDIFFRSRGMAEAVAAFRSLESGTYLIVKDEPDPEAIKRNYAVILDQDTGLVRRVIEKPRYIRNRLKGCGIYLFDQHIFDAVRRTPRTAMRDEYEITNAIQILIDDSEPVHIAQAVAEDVNLTFPCDLLRCNLSELDHRGADNLIHETALVASGAELRRCVLGPNVRITGAVQLSHCLLLEDAVVNQTQGEISHCIITPETTIDCRQLLV